VQPELTHPNCEVFWFTIQKGTGYTEGDPVNGYDPRGLFVLAAANDSFWVNFVTFGSFSGPLLFEPIRLSEIWDDEWDNLSSECQRGLITATHTTNTRVLITTLNRAVAATPALTAAGEANGVDYALLGAIGLRETFFRNINQPDGNGVGIFQIDLGKNPSVTAAQASDPKFAADWAAKYLSGNQSSLQKRFPTLSGDDLIKAVADTYNEGLGGASRKLRAGQDPDSGTTGKNYGSNVLDLTKCFQ
jgi:hypothetical protein